MRGWVAIGLVAFTAACGAGAKEIPLWERPGLYGAVRPEMGSPQPGDAAPDFELPTTGGATFRSASLRGSWVVLHFTASWCPYCDAEVDHLGGLAADYDARNVKVVLVDVEEDEARWAEYAKAHVAPSITALRDATGAAATRFAPPRAQPSFDDRAQVLLDSTLILDPEGKIRLFLFPDSKHFDPTFNAVRMELDRMLGDAPPHALAPEKVVSIDARIAAPVTPGDNSEIVISLRIAPGYHVMSDRPSAPQYIPTRVTLHEVDGIAWKEPRYPLPVAFRLADTSIDTFRGNIEVRVPFDVAANGGSSERTATATLRYQSCTETSCLFPVTRTFEIRIPIESATTPSAPSK